MAQPLAYGFMPMGQSLRINAGLDNPGVLDMLGGGGAPQQQIDPAEQLMQILASQRSRDYGRSPAGPSMQRRFGAGSPLGAEMLPGESAVPPQMGPSAEEVAQLQAALMAAASEKGQADPFMVTRQGTSGTYAGPGLNSSGPLQAEPWYDEYLAAAQGGADLPMVRGSGQNSPMFAQKQKAMQDSQDAEMEFRRGNVQQNAMLKSAARRQRMTGLTDPSYVSMMMQALGAGDDGGMAGNAMLYGPEIAQNLHTVEMQAAMANEARQQEAQQFAEKMAFEREQMAAEQAAQGNQWQRFAGGVMGNAMASGQADLASLLPQLQGAGMALGLQGAPQFDSASGSLPLPPMKLEQAVAASNGDPGTYLRIVREMGGSQDNAESYWTQRTGRSLQQQPSMLDQLTKKTGALGDLSFLGPAPIPWDIPGLPQLSDLFTSLKPAPAQLPARLRPQLQQQR